MGFKAYHCFVFCHIYLILMDLPAGILAVYQKGMQPVPILLCYWLGDNFPIGYVNHINPQIGEQGQPANIQKKVQTVVLLDGMPVARYINHPLRNALVAQMDRAFACGAKGCRFELCRGHK